MLPSQVVMDQPLYLSSTSHSNCQEGTCEDDPLYMGKPEMKCEIKQEPEEVQPATSPCDTRDQLVEEPEYILPHDPPNVKLEPGELPEKSELPDVGYYAVLDAPGVQAAAPSSSEVSPLRIPPAFTHVILDHDYTQQMCELQASLFEHRTSDDCDTGAREASDSGPSVASSSQSDHTGEVRNVNGKAILCYRCSYCDKLFLYRSQLNVHVRVHTGERPYSCDECDWSFKTNEQLVAHKRLHTGEQPYRCAECNKSFSARTTLVRHRRVHTGERPYSCDECDWSFKRKPQLVAHRLVHTKERPYSCDECDWSFKSNARLAAHKHVHSRQRRY